MELLQTSRTCLKATLKPNESGTWTKTPSELLETEYPTDTHAPPVNACTAEKPGAFSQFGKFQYPPHKYGRPKIVVTEGEKTDVAVVGTVAVLGTVAFVGAVAVVPDPEDGAAVPVGAGSVEVGLMEMVLVRSFVFVKPVSLMLVEYLEPEPGASIIQ